MRVARSRGLEVHDAAQRSRQVPMPRRPHAPPVQRRPLSRARIGNRHDDAAAEQLTAGLRDDAERAQLFAPFAGARDALQ